MFDTNTTMTFPIRTADGPTEVTIRWPTDQEWATRHRRMRVVRTNLGRGIHQDSMERGDSDQKLYESIKLNGAPPLTPGEAERVISRIASCEILDVQLGARDAEVKVRILTGEVAFTVRIPNADEMLAFSKTTAVLGLPFNRQQIRPNIDASAALFDACSGRAEDGAYAGAIPNIHKDDVIRAVIQQVELEATPPGDEANF